MSCRYQGQTLRVTCKSSSSSRAGFLKVSWVSWVSVSRSFQPKILFQHPCFLSPARMASQKTIVNFFKPVNKRKEAEDGQDDLTKKIKPAEGTENLNPDLKGSPPRPPKPEGNLPITPEQKLRMEDNKLKAQIKLQSKKTPALHSGIGLSWYQALKSEFQKSYFEKLSAFLVSEREKKTIYPPEEQVYSWTQHCALRDVKVVILGQDPYHGPGQAHGLCFSVPVGIKPPPSLLNMYQELENDIPGFVRPPHGYLLGWAKQGVLLLNACLTVQAHQANSHKDRGWEQFTDAVIKAVSQHNSGVVFLLWGAYAQKKAAVVDKKRHHLLNAPHPSPLSVHRGFFGCKHFSKCNQLLKEAGKKPIEWSYLPDKL